MHRWSLGWSTDLRRAAFTRRTIHTAIYRTFAPRFFLPRLLSIFFFLFFLFFFFLFPPSTFVVKQRAAFGFVSFSSSHERKETKRNRHVVALAAARREKIPKEDATIVFPRCEVRSASETSEMKVYRIQFKLDVSMLNVRCNVYSNNVGKLSSLSKASALYGKVASKKEREELFAEYFQGRNCCVSFPVDFINQFSFPLTRESNDVDGVCQTSR